MAQILAQKQTLKQSPQQMMVSTMVQSTTDELMQLIDAEVEKNFTLEIVDARETSLDAPTASSDDGMGGQMEAAERLEMEMPDDLVPVSREEEQHQAAEDAISFFDSDDDSPSNGFSGNVSDDEGFDPTDNATSDEDFRDSLKRQIDELEITEEEHFLACFIIDSLDDDGYLHRSLQDLMDDLEFGQNHPTTEEDLEAVLVEIVQEELEPSGIGARNLRECLLLQLLDMKGSPAACLAYSIVDRDFEDLVQRRIDRLQQVFGITRYQLVDAMRIIQHLNPKPGGMTSNSSASGKTNETRVAHVRPDFAVRNEDGSLVLTLVDSNMPQVQISADQLQLLAQLQQTDPQQERSQSEDTRAAVKLLKDNIAAGRSFISALQQRQMTLYEVMRAIVELQKDFFLTGQKENLHPMVLQDVAMRSGYDISTISRVQNSKYVDTDFGIMPVKELFSFAVTETQSQAAIIEKLREIIEAEDKQHPLNDEALAAALEKAGYPVARRTVVKYRMSLGYPVARLRREA